MQDDFLDNLPILDTSTLPVVFDDPADRHRTSGSLKPGVRRVRVDVHKRRFRNARKELEAARVLDRLPEDDEVLHLAVAVTFDLHHLLGRVIELADETCREMKLGTLGFGDPCLDLLCNLSDAGKVKRIDLVCSNYFRSVDDGLWARAFDALTRRGHRLFSCRNHAKVAAFRFASGRKITWLSSSNLRSCRNCEAVTIFADDATHGFWTSILSELIEESDQCLTKKSPHI